MLQDPCFRILYRATRNPVSRLGMAVSTKVCKQAVGRNRLKRVIRESFRQHQAFLSGNGSHDIVVLPSRQAATICNSVLQASLARHWRNIHQGVNHRRRGQREKNRKND